MSPITEATMHAAADDISRSTQKPTFVLARCVDADSVPADAIRVSSSHVPAGQVWYGDDGVFYFGIAA